MNRLTKKESEILLSLFKNFTHNYNANSLSKKIGVTPRGALKMLKNLKSQNILTSREFGKAVFYKINFGDEYIIKLMSILLMEEAREKASRWLSEFKELLECVDIAIIFGSIIRNPKTANDIDLLIVFKKERYSMIEKEINQRREISAKVMHVVKQTQDDLIKNLKKKDEVVLNIIKNSYVLQGYEKLVKIIENVTSLQ